MSNPNVPEWLKDTNTNNDASKDVESNAPTSTPTLSSVEMATPADAAAAAPSESACGRCLKLMSCGISLCFFAIFVASATFQGNDTGNSAIVWTIFYALHAVVAGACMVLQCCNVLPCVEKPVLSLASSMLIWSIIMVVTTSIKLSDAESGGADQGGDSANWNDKEEKAYEVAGAALGLASGLYHVLVRKFCVKRETRD